MNNNIKYIGVDIGGSHTKIALVNTKYELLNEESLFYGNLDPILKPKYIYEHITKYIDNLSKEIFDNIKGIAVACPGITKNNKIIVAPKSGYSLSHFIANKTVKVNMDKGTKEIFVGQKIEENDLYNIVPTSDLKITPVFKLSVIP